MNEVEREMSELRQRERLMRDEHVTLRGKAAAQKNRSAEIQQVQDSLMPLAESVLPHMHKVQSLLVKLAPLVEKLAGYVMEGHRVLSKNVDPDWIMVVYGFVLCFFGGHYVALIAAIEAFNLTGWEGIKTNGLICWEQANVALAAIEADDKVDADGDGIRDVDAITREQRVVRRTRVVLLAVDPARVMNATGSLYMAFIAVLATMQIRFAKVVTLGLSIGASLEPLVDKTVIPILQKLSPDEYERWVIVGMNVVVKSISCSLAWVLQTVISALQSASRGGLIVTRAGLRLANKYGYTNIHHEETLLDEFAGWALAAVGFLVQLSFGFAVPFPISLFLWPADIVEYFLRWMVVNN